MPMQEMQVRSLGQEGPLEKEMATRSGVLAWEIPWTEEPGGLQSVGVTKELDTTAFEHNGCSGYHCLICITVVITQ